MARRLVYLDPPFNSQATYNILYKELSGEHSQSQMIAFDDTWQWTNRNRTQIYYNHGSSTKDVIEYEKFYRLRWRTKANDGISHNDVYSISRNEKSFKKYGVYLSTL